VPEKLLEFLNAQPRSLHMHHAVTIRVKQDKVFESGFTTGHKCMHRFDVMGFDEMLPTRTVYGLHPVPKTPS
jgi:hypothetical protein